MVVECARHQKPVGDRVICAGCGEPFLWPYGNTRVIDLCPTCAVVKEARR